MLDAFDHLNILLWGYLNLLLYILFVISIIHIIIGATTYVEEPMMIVEVVANCL